MAVVTVCCRLPGPLPFPFPFPFPFPACLDVAEALGYLDEVDPELQDMLDRIIATLHRLARR